MKRILISTMLLLTIILSGCSNEYPNNNEHQEVEAEVLDKEESSVDYEIVYDNDVSFGNTVRHQYKVAIHKSGTEEDVKIISKDIVRKIKSLKDINAVNIAFYNEGDDYNDMYTIANVFYAPYGEWDKAKNVNSGDYDDFEFSYKFNESYNMSNAEADEEKEMQTDNIGNSKLNLNINIKETINDGKVQFSIETNLPDGTEAILSLEGSNNYLAQDKVTIYDGKANTESFSNKGNSLKGNYTVDFTLPQYQSQSQEVQNILGADYENVTSDYKESGKYGTVITVTKNINVN